MGEHNTHTNTNQATRLNFTRNLLDDIEALEQMLKNDQIESGITRIGAEQEFCLVNKNWRPAKNATTILDAIDDGHFTTELARYNLEINLDPVELTANAFSQVESQLNQLLQKAKEVAREQETQIVLSGILPSISTYELGMDFMTPMPRYFALNEMLKKLRDANFHLHISGVDELSMKHNSVMFEACNTSFQMHLQIEPKDFTSSYNWSQAISGPVLGISVNSPLLLGRELWAETRIALFQQSIDTRSVSKALKNQPSRVAFGDNWITGSIADIFKSEIAKYKIILSKDIEQNALGELEKGKAPKLQAANLHNGTIYNWNRACYGVGNGKAHVRIENRYIPAGPTVLDEMANFAFWVGLMMGRPAEFDDIATVMDFKDAKSNFVKAARTGSESVMCWMGEAISLKELILQKLLPISRIGLEKANIDQKDINRLLGVIEQRTKTHTASQWLVRNYRSLKKEMQQDNALITLTETIHKHQQSNLPVHEWPEAVPLKVNMTASKVGHIMSTQLVTAYANDTAELTLQIMKWQNIHHLPIVNHNEMLLGLLTWNHLQNFEKMKDTNSHSLLVSEIMEQSVITVETSTSIQEAENLMQKHQIGCLPIIQKNQLVGIITLKDLG